MGKKPKSKRNRGGSGKKRSPIIWVFVVMVLAAVGIGVVSIMKGGGDAVAPSSRTADGRLVVMEFFDYG